MLLKHWPLLLLNMDFNQTVKTEAWDQVGSIALGKGCGLATIGGQDPNKQVKSQAPESSH